MTFKKYIVSTFALALIGTAVSANDTHERLEEFDINKVVFIEEDADLGLGFDTAQYLPENFDPYSSNFSLKAINYIEESDEVELGFETSGYLPTGFDPYIQ